MTGIKEYLLSIVAASVVCVICTTIMPKNTSAGKIISILSGICLTITMIAPIAKIDFDSALDYWTDMTEEASMLSADSKHAIVDELRTVITQETEAYILKKANSMGLQLEVSVVVSQDEPYVPYAVELRGTISPYDKAILSQYIEKNLDIEERCQTWN